MKKILLYSLSVIYKTVIGIRNKFYDWNIIKSTEFQVPIICIGNITVGGTGKTPHVEYLVHLLKDNFNVATLSRGYKRKTKGFRLVESDSKVEEVGDEPLQLKKKFEKQTIAVCENRVAGVEKLLEQKNFNSPDVILLDDAFQHRKITPGLNIVLIDYNRPIKKDYMLPLGELRDTPSQLKRANIIIITKCPKNVTPIEQRIFMKDLRIKPYQTLFFSFTQYGNLTPVFYKKKMSKRELKKKKPSILLVTAIASSEPLNKYARTIADNFDAIAFPDHHYFGNEDIDLITRKFDELSGASNKIIVTTEKDAMRLKDIPDLEQRIKKAIYYIPIEIQFLNKQEKEFNTKIIRYVGENKSNREVYKRKD